MRRNVIIHPEAAGGYSVRIPELPGCHSQGATLEEAVSNIREAARLWQEVESEKKGGAQTRTADTPRIPPVPIEYCGKWIIWSADHLRILAHRDTFQELWQFTKDHNIPDAIFEKVPRSNVILVGRR